MPKDQALRRHLVHLLRGGGAHEPLASALEHWPVALRGVKPAGQPHTPWRLLEHIRIAQEDILAFTRDASHASPPWPEGYWPEGDAPPNRVAWSRSVAQVVADLEAMIGIVEDPATDLLAVLPGTEEATVLREALLVADHNAYHQGQLALLRRLLGPVPGQTPKT